MMRSLSPDANVESAGTREPAHGRRGASRRGGLRTAATAAALGLALVSGACGGSETESKPTAATGSWEDVVAAAEKEGKVTIYSGQGTDQLNELAAKFQEKYPKIKVEVVRGVETALAPKVEAEARTGKGVSDLFVTTDRNWLEANKGNFVAPRGPAFDDPAYNKAENVLANNAFVVTGGRVDVRVEHRALQGEVDGLRGSHRSGAGRRQDRHSADQGRDLRRLLPVSRGDLRRRLSAEAVSAEAASVSQRASDGRGAVVGRDLRGDVRSAAGRREGGRRSGRMGRREPGVGRPVPGHARSSRRRIRTPPRSWRTS